MRKHLQYIFLALATVVLAVSCVKELEFEQPMGEGDALTLVPRVRSFANQYVTKATPYDGDKGEKNITRLAVFVFNSKGDLIHWYEDTSGSDAVTLNKSMLNSPAQSSMLDNATVVLIANVNLDDVKKGTVSIKDNSDLTLDDLENYTINTSGTVFTEADLKAEDFSGLPMIGGIKVDLTHAAGSQDVEVGMKILYAKIKFNLSVAAGTENQGSGMKFDLTGYSVHNTSTATTLAIPANIGEKPVDFLGNEKADAVQATVDVATASNVYQTNAKDVENPASTSTSTDGIEFTFYIPESRYNHNLEIGDLQTVYPTDWCTNEPSQDVKNYQTGQRLNKVKYFYDDLTQQFKPKIAEKTGSTKAPQPGAGLATYVLLKGSYTDYKGDIWDLKYKVYLGKDNDQNFHVDRNSIYTNNITIKGIRNNDSYGTDQVWVDHRVTVENASGAADCVTITRETLIDSHIEVRPLRVSWPEGKYDGVRIYLPTNSDGTLVNWIGIERFTGENNRDGTVYCYHGNQSIGKRKYFTTTLVSELQTKEGEFGVREDNGRKYIYLLNGECAWIYFDENTTTSQRQADIDLEFYPESGSTTTAKYIVKQRGLQSIGGYKIESYEEYLHSYDSADKYNLSTSPADYTQQGLAWGFSKETISEDIIVSATQLEILGADLQNYISQRYDYFHKSDIPAGETYYPYIKSGDDWVTAPYGTGLIFTDRASAKKDVTVKDMGTIPDNAYQYCLSKNKFTADEEGNVSMKIHWYLPDVYELQAVLGSTETAEDFDASAYYWSSQPSNDGFSINLPIINREVSIKNEDENNARAVSKSGHAELDRSAKHRIRCFYDATGITADMSDRTPDGVGGNFTFYMKAYNNNDAGYFNYMLKDVQRSPNVTVIEDKYDYNNASYPFPTFSNPGTEFGYFADVEDTHGNKVRGFGKNPLDQSIWGSYTATEGLIQQTTYTYYMTLGNFPGLSIYDVVKDDGYNGKGGGRPTTTEKTDTQVETLKNIAELRRDLHGKDLNKLDYLTNGEMLSISFSKHDNTSFNPLFQYLEAESGSIRKTTIRKWTLPTYNTATYIPQSSFTEEFTGHGEGSATRTNTGKWYDPKWDKTESETIDEANGYAEDAALANALTEAQNKYGTSEFTFTILDDTKSFNTTGEWSSIISHTTYNAESTCTVKITCKAKTTPSPVTYFTDATSGGWDKGTASPKNIEGIETDELRIYCGNSFTISLCDAYKDDYEITKVTVHYSGDSFVTKGNGETILGLEVGVDYLYARFVDALFVDGIKEGDNIELPQEETISNRGSAVTLQLPGMEYKENLELGTGSHQWSGSGRSSVTLVLADYFINNNASGGSITYTYDKPFEKTLGDVSSKEDKYIIIDRIEVKCTPKSTSN